MRKGYKLWETGENGEVWESGLPRETWGYCQDLWSLFQRRLVSTVAGVQALSKQGLGFTGVGGSRKERGGPWVCAEVGLQGWACEKQCGRVVRGKEERSELPTRGEKRRHTQSVMANLALTGCPLLTWGPVFSS